MLYSWDLEDPITSCNILLYAAIHGVPSTVRYLLAKIEENGWKLPGQAADHLSTSTSNNSDVQARTWLSQDPQSDLDYICKHLFTGDSMNNLLYVAISEAGNSALVLSLLKHGADPNTHIERQSSLLHCAIEKGHIDIVRLLLDAGADIHSRCPEPIWSMRRIRRLRGLQALHICAHEGYYEIAKLLIEKGADFSVGAGEYEGHGDSCKTPLQLAVDGIIESSLETDLEGLMKTAQFLVEHGADVTGVANSAKLKDIPKFEGFEDLWDALRAGIEA